MNKIIFLDRDGVLNEHRHDYVKSCSELKLIPGVKEALMTLKDNGYTIIVVSNQSPIGRGILTEDELIKINNHLNDLTGGLIDDFFYCPHKPEDNCGCRKPRTKMMIDASIKYESDLEGKWLIGDSSSDIEMGNNLGLNTIRVKTGLGKKMLEKDSIEPDHIVEDLKEAVSLIISLDNNANH